MPVLLSCGSRNYVRNLQINWGNSQQNATNTGSRNYVRNLQIGATLNKTQQIRALDNGRVVDECSYPGYGIGTPVE